MTKLKLEIGRTVSKNYQSIRVTAGIEDEVNPELKDEWMREAQLWLEGKIAGVILDNVDVSVEEGELQSKSARKEFMEELADLKKPTS